MWGIGVDDACRRRIEGSDLVRRLSEEGPVLIPGGAGWRAAVRQGRCVFLDEQGLCSIQARFGEGAKPLGCTRFPFLLVETPEGPVVGASFCCPAIQANHGRLLEDWDPWLQQNLREEGAPVIGLEPLEAGNGRTLAWADYLVLEGQLLQDVRSPDPASALFRRLQAFCRGLQGSPGNPEESDTGLMVLRPYLMATLVGTIEAATPTQAPALSQALLFADRVTLHRFGWKGDPGRLLEHLDEPGPAALEEEIGRYLAALIQRKWPALDRPLASNLLLLSLVPWLARGYAWAAADLRGAAEPALEDAHRALAWLELRLLTHASGLEPLLAGLTSSLLHQVEARIRPTANRRRGPAWPVRRAAAAGLAVLMGLAALFVPTARPATASVALVVEEPSGHGDDPALRRVLHTHQGAATILLELEDLRNPRLVEELSRDGDQVGVVVHRETPEDQVEALRSDLRRSRHIDLQVAHVEAGVAASRLARCGFRLLEQRPVHLRDAAEAARLAETLGDGSVVVVEGGPTAELLVSRLADRGIRVTPLGPRSSQHLSIRH